MIKFALIGYGYRAKFYIRIAKKFPKEFLVVAVYTIHEKTKQEVIEKEGLFATSDPEDIIKLKPDFIVNASPKTLTHQISVEWIRKGFFVLQETPLAITLEELQKTYENQEIKSHYQVAEQYHRYPFMESIIKIVKSQILGKINHIQISMMHDYHAFSMLRELFSNNDMEDYIITGKKYVEEVARTKSRYETFDDGKITQILGSHIIFEWRDKKAIYDFSSEQYRSPIRNGFIHIKGSRGEIINQNVYFLNDNNEPMCFPIEITKVKEEVTKIVLNQHVLYESESLGLTQDEVAIKRLLVQMKDFTLGKGEVYPLKYAIEDAYASILMNRINDLEFITIESQKRDWMK